MKPSKNGSPRPQMKSLRIETLKTEPETFQFRDMELTEAHVFDLTHALKAGATLEPMTVWKRGDNDYVVLDGHHRHAAYTRTKHTATIKVRVYECEESEATLLALRENVKAKLPMSNTEKTNAAWKLVCSAHGYSKAETVAATGSSDGTVAKMRRVKRALEKEGGGLPDTWWQAMRDMDGFDKVEMTDDMREAQIQAEADALGDKIGKELGRVAERNMEVVFRVLDKYVGNKMVDVVDWFRADDEDDDDFPF